MLRANDVSDRLKREVPAKLLVLLMLSALYSCGGNAPAPVEERHLRPRPPPPVMTSHVPSAYRVGKGDTLYSIAFRYGLDFRKFAAANRIAAPYTIFPGQSLRLREASLQAIPSVTPRLSRVEASPKASPKALPKSSSARQVAKPAVVPKTSQPPAPRPALGANAAAVVGFVGAPVAAWRWPTSGGVVRGYSGSLHKGIDISGRRGDAVSAVAAGKVVYAGTGIVGFGELLIVKHNELYLSAYGHNDRLLVAEGDIVRAGQPIARKGSSGTDKVKLHFEIRKAGKPIDPQRLLPQR